MKFKIALNVLFALITIYLLPMLAEAAIFSTASAVATGRNPSSVTSADFNGDGLADLAVANSLDNSISILTSNASNGFLIASNFTVGINPVSVTSADFNGDGKVDLALASGPSVSVLLGDGAGGFGTAVNFAAGTRPVSVSSGDLNGDGKVDLAVTNIGSNNVSVLLGDGTGGFAAALNFATGTGPNSVTSADFNGDGKPDLVVANQNSNDISVLLNRSPLLISLSLNQPSYITGSTMTLTEIMLQSAPAVNADIYVVLQLPDGTLFSMQPGGGFSPTLSPMAANTPVSAFTGQIFNYTFSGREPIGRYRWLTALTTPGTLNIIAGLAVTPFTFAP